MNKRICIIWNSPQDPKSDIIFVHKDANITNEVTDFLKENWHFLPEHFEKYRDQIQVIEITSDGTSLDARISAHAMYFCLTPLGWCYEKLIEVLDSESVLAAIHRQLSVSKSCTFEVPEDLEAIRDRCGSYLFDTTIIIGNRPKVTIEVIGYLKFITAEMALAIKTLHLDDHPDSKIDNAKEPYCISAHLEAQSFIYPADVSIVNLE